MMKYLDEFAKIKELTEKHWGDKPVDESVYGFQIQQGTKWKKGLSRNELMEFENMMGFEFPEILKDYYTIMNGVDKEQINVYGNCGEPYAYAKMVYSFPDDIKIIKGLIKWVYDENHINENEMEQKNIPRIFPIYCHRFMLMNDEENPIFSMYGNDIILYANDIMDLLKMEIGIQGIKLNNNIKLGYWDKQ